MTDPAQACGNCQWGKDVMKTIWLVGAALMLSACVPDKEPPKPFVMAEGIVAKDVGVKLIFAREYRKAITPNVEVVVTLDSDSYFGRVRSYSTGMLRQLDGKRVHFMLENIAERIVQQELIAPVEQAVEEIIAADAAYMKSNPGEIVDTTGARWVRVHEVK